jgi:hypothetical protein
LANEARYEARGWLGALSAAALVIAGLYLLVLFYTRREGLSFWMGVTAVGLGVVQLVHQRRSSLLVLSESGISWSRGPVRSRLQVDFSMVLSWYNEDRKLVFATRDGKTCKIDLFGLAEGDRDDVRTKLTRYLGEPNRPAA